MHHQPSDEATGRGAAPAGVFAEARARPTADAAAFAGWLYKGARALAEAATPGQVVEAAARETRAAYAAAAVAVVALEPRATTFRVLHVDGVPADLARRYRRLPLRAPGPLADAVATRGPVFITGHEDARAHYPEVVAGMKEAGFAASASVPISVDRTTVAVLNLMFRTRRAFGEHDRTFLMTMAEMLSQALRRTWLYESEQHARIDAEAANQAKTEFLAVMSHELRTPLNAIIGYAQILAHGIHGDLNPQQYRDIDRLQHSAQHLLALLNHVIGFAQLERDHVLLELGAVPVHGLIAEVQTLVAEQVAARSQQLTIAPCDPATVVRGDRDKIALVLLNLLMNATRHTPVGGVINVWCERVGQRAMIKVQDSGMGVPVDQLERIFEPFVQLGRGLTGTHEGTGLGLAIGRELARRMGGDLHAEHEVDAGGRFVVTLPLWLLPELDPPA